MHPQIKPSRTVFDGDLEHRFAEPPRDFSPTPLWWWSAEEVTDERLGWQLARFAEGGVYNLVVIGLAPTGPLFGAETDSPRWFSEAWWQRFEFVCRTAGELGMRIWFYDQIGFSGANVQGRVTRDHPECRGRALRRDLVRVVGGRLPVDGSVLAATLPDGGRARVGEDGTVDGVEEGTEVAVVSSVPTAFDYLSPVAVARLIDAVHGEFERRVPQYLGSVIAGSFQDELPTTNTWTDDFPAEFARRCGYDLLDHLESLFGPGDVTDEKVRSDYYRVRAELTEAALFEPLAAWHRAHGMLLGADQYNPARAGFPLQGTQIYTDYPRTHRHYSAVGSDHEGDSRFHASLGRLYGHERVWLEAFHSSGWGGTLEETWDWLIPFLRSGADLYDPHATYYATVGGWFEWAPPSTDWRQPYWAQYGGFATAVARVTSILRWGTFQSDVAVLHPTATMQAALPLDIPVDHFFTVAFDGASRDVEALQATYLRLVGKNDWFHFEPSALEEAGIAFDIVDDASVQRADVDDGRMRVAEQRWSTVLVPGAVFLEPATAERLLAHLDHGGRVVLVGERPRHVTGRDGDDGLARSLVAHPRCESVPDADAAVRLLAEDDRDEVRCRLPVHVRRRGDVSVALLGGAFPNATAYPRRAGLALDPVDDADFDRSRYARAERLEVPGPVAAAELWDPATGARTPLRTVMEGDRTEIEVETGGAPSSLVVWRTGEPAAAEPPEPAPAARRVDWSEGWTGTLVPTVDNRWGDVARPVGRPLDAPEVWAIEVEEGGRWRETRVTQGQRAAVLPAAPHGSVPPLSAAECERVVADEAPLAPLDWAVQEWSASRGRARNDRGLLPMKGRVPSEFLVIDTPSEGAETGVRTIVRTPHRGPADIVLVAAAPARVWWNGRELDVPDVFTRQLRVDVEQEANVLEYRLGHAPRTPSLEADRLGSAFSLFPPGGFDARPEHLEAPGGGAAVFERRLPHSDEARSARLVVGCSAGATVLLDGATVGRQERAEYYESEWGAPPSYFAYDVDVPAGSEDPVLEIRTDADPSPVIVWADVRLVGPGSDESVVSDAAWTCTVGGATAAARVVNRRYTEPESCFAVSRPHPLPDADWLRGPAVRGTPALRFAAAVEVAKAPVRLRALLPAGTTAVHLPLTVPEAQVSIDGTDAELDGARLRLAEPLPHPALLVVTTAPTTVRGGAVLSGPIVPEVTTAPLPLGDWRALGLAAWSGGVRYRRTLPDPIEAPWSLDLGDLRGTVEVLLDDRVIATAFCAPFVFGMPAAAAGTVLDVIVRNTLGPLLHESTPTTWVFPSQRSSGLFGPVTVLLPTAEASRRPNGAPR